ncbi:uracil-DNA glycosylase [Sorangium sp. So ce1036]|uniref:uracil-DNA glycosylase n=1 Tax=Sorangium sp. So ce1036 TaxID=3133328 RepID=UPI003F0FC852
MSRGGAARALARIEAELVECRRCPRLVTWREDVAREKRRAYRDQTYWGRPVPGFGDPEAPLVIVGLAPAAHGANRTGRMFTGDRSGDFLYAALFRAGIASQPTSTWRGDGLALRGAFITAPCHCAPPDNKPTSAELASCRGWLERELGALRGAHVYLALGRIGYEAVGALARARSAPAAAGEPTRRRAEGPPRLPPFAHGVEALIPDPRGGPGEARLFGSYHVSQQNTQTGRLTEAMFDEVLRRALRAADLLAQARSPT